MNFKKAQTSADGLTLIEFLVLIAVVAILAALALPTSSGPRRAEMTICLNNQKQIALGLTIFKDDHAGEYPWQVSTTNGGTSEFVSTGEAFPHFRAFATYYGKQTRVFLCPTDRARTEASDFAHLVDTNISYFLDFDALTNGTSILSGDRHLEANGKAINHGLFAYSTNSVLNWTRELHGKVQKGPIGGLGFGDGHVRFTRANDLNLSFQNQPLATNRLIIP